MFILTKSRAGTTFLKKLDNPTEIVLYMQGDEEELKHAVAFVRPVSIAFQVVKDFRLYKSGVYTSDTCRNTPMVSYSFLTR